jgi:hypothetical protein
VILRPGTRWRSTAGGAEIVVVRAPEDEVTMECNGAPMEALESGGGGPADGEAGETPLLLGKRYEAAGLGVEVLCSKAGPGPLRIDDEVLVEKGAKPLPSSD